MVPFRGELPVGSSALLVFALFYGAGTRFVTLSGMPAGMVGTLGGVLGRVLGVVLSWPVASECRGGMAGMGPGGLERRAT